MTGRLFFPLLYSFSESMINDQSVQWLLLQLSSTQDLDKNSSFVKSWGGRGGYMYMHPDVDNNVVEK